MLYHSCFRGSKGYGGQQMSVWNVEENEIIDPFKNIGDGFGFEYSDQEICGCVLNVAS